MKSPRRSEPSRLDQRPIRAIFSGPVMACRSRRWPTGSEHSGSCSVADIKHAEGKKKRCFPHMFRDTFAVELLLAGVPLAGFDLSGAQEYQDNREALRAIRESAAD
jgi:hypothetical protein